MAFALRTQDMWSHGRGRRHGQLQGRAPHRHHPSGVAPRGVGTLLLLLATSITSLPSLVTKPWAWSTPLCKRILVTRSVWGDRRHSGVTKRMAYGSAAAQKQAAWSVLDLPPGSTKKQIRSRFRTLASTEHPDKNPGDPKAAEKFSRITAAYELLMTDEPVFESPPSGVSNAIPVEEAEARFRKANGYRPKVSTTDENAFEYLAVGSGLVVVAAVMFKALSAVACAVSGDFCDDGGDALDLSLGISPVDYLPLPGESPAALLEDASQVDS